ncbi:MAG: DNA polymerase III subunit beta [Oscillospiraceae bacterium]|nr:DNA polymerase III subunit beta [Oscillospiraceae bacterium]
MKILCDKTSLMEAVGNVQRAVSVKSTIPALEGILLRADEGTQGGALLLTGYDLEIGITTAVPATVTAPGDIVLPARLFGDIVRRLPADEVTLETGSNHEVKIASGDARFAILGLPADEYPVLPAVGDGVRVTVPQQVLKGMIRQTLFAVAKTDARPVHTGTLFELSADTLRLVSVDGTRLAIRTETIQNGEETSFVVPGKTLAEVLKLLRDTEDELTISAGKRHLILTIDGYSVISRLLDGEFLPYRKAIPATAGTVLRLNTREWTEAVERTALVIHDRLKSPLVCRFEDGFVHMTCTTTLGSVSDRVPAAIEGDGGEMGFNCQYLLDALKNAECDEVRVELSGATAPMKILPPEGEGFLFLVLPVRLKR